MCASPIISTSSTFTRTTINALRDRLAHLELRIVSTREAAAGLAGG